MMLVVGILRSRLLAWLGPALLFVTVALAAHGCGAAPTGSNGGDGTGGAFSHPSSSGTGGQTTSIAISDSETITLNPGDGGPSTLLGDGGGTLLDITPANPVVNVTIVDGTITTTPVAFSASANGTAIGGAEWSLDRGDLGSINSGGTFTANGALSGVVTVTAAFGAHLGTTQATVQISVVNHGGTPLVGDAGPAGYGGVGGEGPGGPADASLFAGTVTTPTSAAELSFLYPYDQTVWPRGLLAPLLQWTTTHTATAVYIHLSQTDYDFKGYYAFAPGLTGMQLMRQPIDQNAWDQATHGNQGGMLHVEVTIAATDGVFGPIAEDWTISPDILQGTVYYASYNTVLNINDAGVTQGAVLQIQPGVPAPSLAVPSLQGTCHVCHEVAANGSSLFATYGAYNTSGTYNGGSYDLTNAAALITPYGNGIFTYSGLYPDGTFGLANSNDNWWAYTESSNIFSRATQLAIPSTGFTNLVQQAVTPAFSPDGQHVAFNFRQGQGQSNGDAGAAPGDGSLVVMDFDCGATAGSVTCGTPPYTFSNLRQIYNDSTRYAGWPSFSPDGNYVVFQSTITPSGGGSALNTYENGTAELMIADGRLAPQMSPQPLCALNGYESDCATSYLPDAGTNHAHDTEYNYEPTVNPIASGGYYWVVFTSRRLYGNVAQGDPYTDSAQYSPVNHPITKKLWVAAIDENPTSGKDPSHPAFYLPGQELNAGDMKGYWVVEPCRPDGSSCTTGDQCCDGFCRSPPDGGPLVCLKSVPGCANEFEKCITAADCCGAASGYLCLNGYCSEPPKVALH
jgi:hypothetical protein